MRIAALFLGIAAGCVLSASAFAQDNVAAEAAHRSALLATLPQDAAQRVFGLEQTPRRGARKRSALTSAAVSKGRSNYPPTARTGRSCARRATAPGAIRR